MHRKIGSLLKGLGKQDVDAIKVPLTINLTLFVFFLYTCVFNEHKLGCIFYISVDRKMLKGYRWHWSKQKQN